MIVLAAGVLCFFATQFIKRKLVIDDSLDVFPVHGVGGILGTLLVGVFASPALGIFSGYGFANEIESIGGQLYAQSIGVVATIVYTVIATFVIVKITGLITSGIRVDKDVETQGLDIALHEESGYTM